MAKRFFTVVDGEIEAIEKQAFSGKDSRHSSPSIRNCSTASSFNPAADAARFLSCARKAWLNLQVPLPSGCSTA